MPFTPNHIPEPRTCPENADWIYQHSERILRDYIGNDLYEWLAEEEKKLPEGWYEGMQRRTKEEKS